MTTVIETPLPNVEDLLPKVELLEEDGEPLESSWHRACMNLLIECVEWHLRGREDFYVGGNQFIYYDEEQARMLHYRGPDFYFVEGRPHSPPRRYWVVWQEGGRYPDVIIELSSPKTTKEDHTTKKDIYERVFRTYEYYCYDPDTQKLEGWRLVDGRYVELTPDAQGRLECKKLGLWLGTWKGKYLEQEDIWLRFFDAAGNVAPIRAEAEHQRAEAERQRADRAEAELAALKARLAAMQSGSTAAGESPA
ncbi:MAG: Uma2 family endonuclease [Gemmataceae bacterium]|nr:Uma2 family endonuclease [Gemmataceae bacterium]MDW8265207.1 Uma2 family endonuclease [Gemmataceae bacterium]